MNDELFNKIANEVDALETEWLSDPQMKAEQRELRRQKYAKDWENVCSSNGVTVEEFDIAMEERLNIKYKLEKQS